MSARRTGPRIPTPTDAGYRHARYAGNFGDVLKHLVLVALLRRLAGRSPTLRYIDTHAGRGRYATDANGAAFRSGIGRLRDDGDVPDAVADYLALCRRCSSDAGVRASPGSPWLAAELLRPGDPIMLFETQPDEAAHLAQLFSGRRNTEVIEGDGFRGCLDRLAAACPDTLVLLDPPYRLASDAARVADTLVDAQRLCPAGVCCAWYPLAESVPLEGMQARLRDSGLADIERYELRLPRRGAGMQGCGMLLLNAPADLRAALAPSLAWLARVLGEPGAGSWRMDSLRAP